MKKLLSVLLALLLVVIMTGCAQISAGEDGAALDITRIHGQLPALMVTIGVLVVLTNIIVEVLKKMTWDKVPTNLLAILVALALTLVVFFAWAAYMGITVLWYYVAAVVVVGFLVAYAAMFGFDKLREALGKIQELKK